MDIKAIENIETAEEITKIIDEAFSPSYMYYDVWGVIKGEWKEEIAVKDEAYSLLFQIQEINRLLHGDNITISEHVPNLHERSDLMTKRSDLAIKVKSLLEGKTQQNNDNKQLQQEHPEQQPKEDNENDCSTDISFPEELNNDNAKSIISKVIKAGLCDHNYKWLKTKSLLAYFADRASEYLKLGKGEYNGKIKTSWKPFETLFGISGLCGAKKDYQRTGTLPVGYKDVDKLFE